MAQSKCLRALSRRQTTRGRHWRDRAGQGKGWWLLTCSDVGRTRQGHDWCREGNKEDSEEDKDRQVRMSRRGASVTTSSTSSIERGQHRHCVQALEHAHLVCITAICEDVSVVPLPACPSPSTIKCHTIDGESALPLPSMVSCLLFTA